MEVARLLASAKDAPVVVGLILIDSPYSQPWREHRDKMVDFTPEFPAGTSERVKSAITKRMDVCDQIIDNWNVPSWSDVRPAGFRRLPCLYQPLQGRTQILQTTVAESRVSQHARQSDQPAAAVAPPAVLLRATERVPLPSAHPNGLIDVDLSRESNMLAWDEYPYDFLKAVYDIEGHHFDLFDGDSRLDKITMFINQACRKLESKKAFVPTF